MLATQYNPTWLCECGNLMQGVWGDQERTWSFLVCSTEGCPHKGLRFDIPKIELRELPDYSGWSMNRVTKISSPLADKPE